MFGYRKIARLSALADSFDLFMIDQFGVLHDGVSPYLGAIECLASLKARGKGVVLLSNSGNGLPPTSQGSLTSAFPASRSIMS